MASDDTEPEVSSPIPVSAFATFAGVQPAAVKDEQQAAWLRRRRGATFVEKLQVCLHLHRATCSLKHKFSSTYPYSAPPDTNHLFLKMPGADKASLEKVKEVTDNILSIKHILRCLLKVQRDSEQCLKYCSL